MLSLQARSSSITEQSRQVDALWVSHQTLAPSGLTFRCVATPCHTRGHVCFFLDANDGQESILSCCLLLLTLASPIAESRAFFCCLACEAPALFSGDALFVAGCGRFMEGPPPFSIDIDPAVLQKTGTAVSMKRTLQALAALPEKTRIFCGHEYTVPGHSLEIGIVTRVPAADNSGRELGVRLVPGALEAAAAGQACSSAGQTKARSSDGALHIGGGQAQDGEHALTGGLWQSSGARAESLLSGLQPLLGRGSGLRRVGRVDGAQQAAKRKLV